MTNTETKNILTSKTVWASVVVVVISTLTATGVIKPNEVAPEEVTTNIWSIVQGVAGLVAVYGRVTATQEISITKTEEVQI